ncbi:MAG: ABC-F family ATP-binding cassette domain-containing protein [Breznakibacter sp.]
MLIAQGISYSHPDKEQLFEHIDFSLQKQDKVALIGHNGSGKSTLLKLIGGILSPGQGVIKSESAPYYVPQHFGQYNQLTVAEALQVTDKLNALHAILQGDVSDHHLQLLNDDWSIEERCAVALDGWNLSHVQLDHKMSQLSGGEKTKVFLAGIAIHHPGIVLLDEPTNHLDTQGRNALYRFIDTCTNTLVVVSHDRTLLELLSPTYELSRHGITVYGGNYSFYKAQKEGAENALSEQVEEHEKALRKARKAERDSMERKQRQDTRGKGKHEKEGVARIMMNTLRNKAEASSARLKDVHAEKIGAISDELTQARQKLSSRRDLKMSMDSSGLHFGKILITAQQINFGYRDKPLWNNALNFQITSGERICVTGANGSGKTTLIRILLGNIIPTSGVLQRAGFKSAYIDQDYSLIRPELAVYEQAQQFNVNAMFEHELKTELNRYLFDRSYWNKPCHTLSGGEKMRLTLCCLMIGNNAPDLLVLDEPTNNLDIQSIGILTSAVNDYTGTLLVVSHDTRFLEEIHVEREIGV